MANPGVKKSTYSTEDEFMDPKTFENMVAGKKPQTTEELVQASAKADAEIQSKVNQVRINLMKEEKVKIRISPAYKPHLGNRCQLIINGVAIVVPCDGSMVEIPGSYAAELYRRMAGIDRMLDQQIRMSNYQQNREQVIGEIKF